MIDSQWVTSVKQAMKNGVRAAKARRRKTKPLDDGDDRAMIERFLQQHGATICPPRFCAKVQQ